MPVSSPIRQQPGNERGRQLRRPPLSAVSVKRLVQCGIHLAEGRYQLATKAIHGRDDDGRNTCSNQAVFVAVAPDSSFKNLVIAVMLFS